MDSIMPPGIASNAGRIIVFYYSLKAAHLVEQPRSRAHVHLREGHMLPTNPEDQSIFFIRASLKHISLSKASTKLRCQSDDSCRREPKLLGRNLTIGSHHQRPRVFRILS